VCLHIDIGNGVLGFVQVWEYKCEGAMFSAFMIPSNDDTDPNAKPKRLTRRLT